MRGNSAHQPTNGKRWKRDSLRPLQFILSLTLLTVLGCQKDIDDSAGFPLHSELEVDRWQNAESAGTLRAQLEIPGVLSPTPLAIDLASKTLIGNLTVPNQDLGDVEVILSYFASLDAEHAEVLIAESVTTIRLQQDKVGRLEFPTLSHAATDPRFDVNRNGRSNLDDLKIAINPAPTPNPIVISPRTVSFESGVDVGGFTRAFFVVSNTAEEAMLVDFSVQLAAGLTIAPLEQVFEIGAAAPDTATTIRLGPGEDQVMAVTFAPSNSQFVVDAMSVSATGVDSTVQYGSLMRLLGNPEGAIPQPPSSYEIPAITAATLNSEYSGEIEPLSADALFSRAPSGLGAIEEASAGKIAGYDIDTARTVLVPAGYRFSLTLDGIEDDVDLYLFELTQNETGYELMDSNGESEDGITPVSTSTRGGASAEVISFDATEIVGRDTLLLIGVDRVNIELEDYNAVPAGLSDGSNEPTTQSAMRREPEAKSITSLSTCPSDYDERAACSPAEGGSQVVIRGRNFEDGLTVFIAGNQAVCAAMRPANFESEVEEERQDQVTCITPPATFNPRENPKATIVVQNPNGSVATFPEALTYLPPRPVIYSVGPNRGPLDGGATIVINGDHFYRLDERIPEITFGENQAEFISVTPEGTALQVTLPACESCEGETTVDVSVANPDKQSYTSVAAFTYFQPLGPAPSITSVTPENGYSTGGYDVVIAGENFTDPMQVRIADSVTPVPQELINLDAEAGRLTVVMPSGPPRSVAIEVSNSAGQTDRLANAFTYIQPPPSFNSIAPIEGLIGGGTITVIIGQGFQPGVKVFFGDTEASQVAYNSTTSLTVITPPHPEALVDLRILNLDGQETTASAVFSFVNPTLPAPTIDSLSPTSGSIAGGTDLTLVGSGFQSGAQVRFGAVASPSVSVLSDTEIRARSPSQEAGVVDIQVINPDGQFATASTAYAYVIPAPTLSAVIPAQGPTSGGTVILLTGSGFREGASVTVDGVEASNCTVNGTTSISCTTPPHDPGQVTVRVRNPDGQSATNAYTYIEPELPPPNIYFLSPDQGTELGGTPVEIHGINFDKDASVYFGARQVEIVYQDLLDHNAQILQVIAPVGQAGQSVSVQVQNDDGQSDIALLLQR